MAIDSSAFRFQGTSLKNARWVTHNVSLNTVQIVTQKYGISELLARFLIGRGVHENAIEDFLNPKLATHFPDPFMLKDMDKMADYVAESILANKNFAIFGDFDVDGATSSAVMHRYLKTCGIDAPITIPDRLKDGYGPNIKAFQDMKDMGTDIVFVLDCGITSFDIIKQGTDLGLDIIILDHHEAENALPMAKFVIDPKRQDDESHLSYLAAVGVTYLACVAINKTLREKDFWSDKSEPDMRAFLDLVAFGTVCDMVPLIHANRLFIKHGLHTLNTLNNKGVASLKHVSGLDEPITPSNLGFVFGPRINAGGRIHQADLGARLLITDDDEEAHNIAWQLEDCNKKRRDIQNIMIDQAEHMIADQGLENAPVIIVDHPDWHPGLSGLVAGKIKDKHNKPACVVTYTKLAEGGLEGRGSGRSVDGVHLANAFIEARNEGILIKGGGHAMAGGFTIAPDKLDEFRTFMMQNVKAQMEGNTIDIQEDIDLSISVRGVTVDMVKQLRDQAGPFGMKFEKPLIALKNVRIHTADIIGERHIRLLLSDADGGTRIKAVSFGSVGTPMGDAFLNQSRTPFHICGYAVINNWQGRESAELHVHDAMVVNG